MYHYGVRRQSEEAVKNLAKGSKLEITHTSNQQLPLCAIFDFRFFHSFEAATALWLVYGDAPYLMRCCSSVATDPIGACCTAKTGEVTKNDACELRSAKKVC